MTLESQLIVRGKLDYCSVTQYLDGSVQIGSIKLDLGELREFIQILTQLADKFESPCGDSKQQAETK